MTLVHGWDGIPEIAMQSSSALHEQSQIFSEISRLMDVLVDIRECISTEEELARELDFKDGVDIAGYRYRSKNTLGATPESDTALWNHIKKSIFSQIDELRRHKAHAPENY